ncbi:hypothetical protein [Frigoriglobus tundricola]|uniref:Uncharacterized protein n=1 Tax=Frigoriglobus tundricola TaxID=2774151 RepID=A0A6M5YNK4_9BACT|nr:hypothetical protein [Frigoriglobus tundricola]QJW95565.1 hypothetical protein FTUN_3115 [Frigoriglobus tundricola]
MWCITGRGRNKSAAALVVCAVTCAARPIWEHPNDDAPRLVYAERLGTGATALGCSPNLEHVTGLYLREKSIPGDAIKDTGHRFGPRLDLDGGE